jgi:hypothetical protein
MSRTRQLLALCALALAGSAEAQSKGAASTKLEQAQAFDHYSACIVGRDARTADQLALESRYGGEITPLIGKLMPSMRACLQSNDKELMRISPYLLRGELARALLLGGAKASRRYEPPSDPDRAGKNGDRATLEWLVFQFSDCLIGAAPEAADDFVRSLSGSAEERAAFARLQPASESCALAAAADLKLGSDQLRTGLAIALYGRTAGGAG